MADLMQAARIAVQMEAALAAMKRIHGEQWEVWG